ncbi:MAG: fibronectin type III domain-containing protein, partial [Clostridia bacterium]|nr:fibronectin type III domain-containing protein [Clostridia bacterium]
MPGRKTSKVLAVIMVVVMIVSTGVTINFDAGGQLIELGSKAYAAVDDQYTKALLHFDGANGSKSFTEESGKAVTAYGDAQISTAQSKFGGSSAYFDGSGDYLSITNSTDFDFGNGNFTIDWWDYVIAKGDNMSAIARTGVNTWEAFAVICYGGNYKLFMSSNGSSWDIASNVDMGVIPLNTWTHWAISRNGNTFYIFKNGNLVTSFTSSLSLVVQNNNLQIGGRETKIFNGYIDELRISKGIARWTSNFTPPVDKYYPNSVPLITVKTPVSNQVFSENDVFIPSIQVSDADNSTLTCRYYIDTEDTPRETRVISNTASPQDVMFASIDVSKLSQGNHNIKYEVSDGVAPVTQTVSFTVGKAISGDFAVSSTTNSVIAVKPASESGTIVADNSYRFSINGNVSDWMSGKTVNIAASIPTFVANSAYDTSGNGGRKITRLSNGWYVAAAYTGSVVNFHISKDSGQTWSLLCSSNTGAGVNSYAICSYGTNVYFFSVGSASFLKFDATTVTQGSILNNTFIEAQTAFNGCSIAVDSNGVIHAAWASKNSSYPNLFNIRYIKSTDGGVTWNSPTQISQDTTTITGYTNPSIVLKNGIPYIICQFQGSTSQNEIGVFSTALSTKGWTSTAGWNNNWIYKGYSYVQSNPSAVISPNGEFHVAWQGKDSIDSAYETVFYSNSIDDGITWSAPTKIETTGGNNAQRNPSITANKNNEVFIVWDSVTSTNWFVRYKKKTLGGTWSTRVDITTSGNGNNTYPQVCADYNDFSVPLTIWKDSVSGAVRFYGQDNAATVPSPPTTVAGSAYDLSGNGGRKITRLSNGWFVTGVYDSINQHIKFFVSKDSGSTWSQLCYSGNGWTSGVSFALTSYGTNIYCIVTQSSSTDTNLYMFDTLTQTNTLVTTSTLVDRGQTSIGSGISIAVDSNGKLWAAWSSKNASYPNCFNIRVSSSTDGGQTWAAPTQVTNADYTGYNMTNPCIVVRNNLPIILYQYYYSTVKPIMCSVFNGTKWTDYTVYNNSSYAQENPSVDVSPDGTIHAVWYGLDSTDTNAYNIRYAKSTDGGVTWSAATKLTSGNSLHQGSPSVVSDKNNCVYVVWIMNIGSLTQIKKMVWTGNVWSSQTILTNSSGNQSYPQTCNNYRDFSDPIMIWQDNQTPSIKFRGTWRKSAEISFKQENLSPNTKYPVKLETKDSAGNITAYTKDVYTIAEIPKLTTTTPSATSVILTVTDSNPAYTQYQITCGSKYINQLGKLTSTPVWITLTNKKITVTGLMAGTSYTFRLKARNAEGIETEPSNSISTLSQTPPLPAPEGLTATGQSAGKIRITWKLVEGAAGYLVEVDGDAANLKDAGTNLWYEHTGLEAGSVHRYRVCAKNGETQGNWSTVVSAKTKQLPPNAPSSVVVNPTGTTATITWSGVIGAVDYDIELDGEIKALGNTTTYIHTGLKPLTQHTYRVRAKNTEGVGVWSELQSAVTTSGIPTTAPEVTTVAYTNEAVTLNWNMVTDAESYEVVEVINSIDSEPVDTGMAAAFESRGLMPGSSHTYKVRAKNSMGAGPWSNLINVTLYILDTPKNIAYTESDKEITFSWDAVQGAASYEISLDNQIITGITGTSYTKKDLLPETKYNLRIRAVGSSGESGWSMEIPVFTLPEKPGVPSNVNAAVSNTTITLSWTLVTGAEGYDIELDGVIIENDSNTTTYIHSELEPFTLHTYRVRARNSAVAGDWSEKRSIRTLPGKPESPDWIIVNSMQTGATLSWGAELGATGYDIEVFDGTNTTIVQNISRTNYTHRRVAQGVECRYRIRTRNVEGASSWSGYIINNAIKANCKKNNTVDLGLTATDVVDFSSYTMTVTYNSGVIEVADLCTLSGKAELTAGKIEGTDITIKEFTPGRIVFVVDKAVDPGEAWTGVINSIKFKAKVT